MSEGKEKTSPSSQQSTAVAKPVRLEEQPTVITTPEALVPVSSPEIGVEILAPKVGPGSTLGPYEILEYIGGGGMGRVFRAFDVRLSRVVALKVLTPEQAADSQTLARFQNEARSAARLNHPGIVQVYAAGEQDGVYYIAFEYIDGTNLRKLVEEKGPLPWRDAARYILQVVEALDHATRRGVVHRDIKPSNIIVTQDGQAKLIDLGLARIFQPGGRSQDITSSGTTLGTFDYIAPEQARDPRLADARSDIYSLGCTLYYLLSGQPPFPGGTVLQKLLQHQTEEPADIRKIRKDVPEELVRVLRRMMAKSPRQRFQSPSELAAALRDVIGENGRSARASEGKNAKRRELNRWRRHLPWLVPMSALLVVTMFLDWWFSHGAEETTLSGDEIEVRAELFSPPTPAFRTEDSLFEKQSRPSSNLDRSGPRPTSGMTQPNSSTSSPQTVPKARPENVSSRESAGQGTTISDPGTGPRPSLEGRSANDPVAQPSGTLLPVPGSLQSDVRYSLPDVLGAGGQSSVRVPNLPSLPDDTPLVPSELRENRQASEQRGVFPLSSSGTGEGGARSEQGFGTLNAWIRWVDPAGRREGSFPTLEAACRAALPGDEIRLDFDGTLPVRGIDLRGRRLKIVGERGRFPELVFRNGAHGPSRSEPFLLLAASDVSFENVAFRFEIGESGLPSSGACFRLIRNSRLAFNRCVLTAVPVGSRSSLATSLGDSVFFESGDDPQSEVLVKALMPEAEKPAENVIEMNQTVLRGLGSVLRSAGTRGGELHINESLIAVESRLLEVTGTDRAPDPEARWKVSLRRVTAFSRQGLFIQKLAGYQWHILPIRVESQECILVGSREASFVEQVGMAVEKALQSFSWFGQNNFYEVVTRFWSIKPDGLDTNAYYVSFESWTSYWRSEHESNPAYGAVPWAAALPLTKPAYLHQPSDYRLADPTVDDVAAEIAGKAGCPIDLLPMPPLSLP